ncbi:thioredoxin family protein [Flavobacterium sp.]|uniref:thioredoxin family protein n=1 Tax=Flavobacterium sp. TaxID=239 RepID=UPI00262F8D8A|nr:thioredoxin family protein [Flavobacterium sp.]
MKDIFEHSFSNAFSYGEYRAYVSNLLADGKSTGHKQSEDLTHYSKMNEARMNRLDKTIVIGDAQAAVFQSLHKKHTWLVLSEGWCGDAAQALPVMHKLASFTEKIDLKIVLRDDNAGLMDLFLTNGSRSIPKLIALDEAFDVKALWGPRPEPAIDLVTHYKKLHGVFDDAGKTALQLWYTKNKGNAIQQELATLMENL